jgi:N-acetyl sugar amidotransferase
MDTTDPNIRFDEHGVCNHCTTYHERASTELFHHDESGTHLERLLDQIKAAGRRKDYDCIIGVSGGVDSTYVALKVKEFGLRPLAIHLDNGWNSNLAVTNIQNTLKALDIDLHTIVLDWDEFKTMQLSFLHASTPDSEVPTDHAIQAVLFKAAKQFGVRYVIGGSNFETEAIMPIAWSHGMRDWKYIRNVHRRFSDTPLRTFPHFTLSQFAYDMYIKRLQLVYFLNYIPYVKSEAMKTIQDKLGWVYYGGKHYESIYTRFFQGYILPNKFGFDKRRGHESTLVCSNQITRDQALSNLEADPYSSQELLREDREFVIKKLGITEEQFGDIMSQPAKTFWDYPSYEKMPLYGLALRAYRLARSASMRRRPSTSEVGVGDGSVSEIEKAA